MANDHTLTTPELPQELRDFSLVLGGPFYRLLRWAHLTGPALEQLPRRILFSALITWLPLAVLSLIEGNPFGIKLTFLHDVEAQVRFLVAVPVLIAAEPIVHWRMRVTIVRFVDRGIIRPEDFPKFKAAIEAATRLRDSLPLELALPIFVYTVGQWVWRSQSALETASWYGAPHGAHLALTLPGYWYAFVSLPFFQFILLRWYVRFFIWFRFLWMISRFDLHLLPAHPDRAGGIGFLGVGSYAFGPILFAQGAVLAGLIANRIFYQGQNLLSFKLNILAFVAVFLAFTLAPLLVFTPQLNAAKRRGLGEYGTLAASYVSEFEVKWLPAGEQKTNAHHDELLGSGDFQSLADLGNSFGFVRDMRLVPFSLEDVFRLAIATALPLLPLLLTIMPLDELLTRLAKIIF
jgi:hypothetical protein